MAPCLSIVGLAHPHTAFDFFVIFIRCRRPRYERTRTNDLQRLSGRIIGWSTRSDLQSSAYVESGSSTNGYWSTVVYCDFVSFRINRTFKSVPLCGIPPVKSLDCCDGCTSVSYRCSSGSALFPGWLCHRTALFTHQFYKTSHCLSPQWLFTRRFQ